jgi:hypothetical protein
VFTCVLPPGKRHQGRGWCCLAARQQLLLLTVLAEAGLIRDQVNEKGQPLINAEVQCKGLQEGPVTVELTRENAATEALEAHTHS